MVAFKGGFIFNIMYYDMHKYHMYVNYLVGVLFVCLVFFVRVFFKFIFGRGGVVNRIRPVGCYARQNKSFVGICQLHNV